LKQDSPHYFQVCIILKTHILWKLAIGHERSLYWLTFKHSKLFQYTSYVLALVQINCLILLNMIYLYPAIILDLIWIHHFEFFRKIILCLFQQSQVIKSQIQIINIQSYDEYGHHNSFQALKRRNMHYSYCFKPYKDFWSLHVPYFPYLWPQSLLIVAYIFFEMFPFKKKNLTSIWCTSRSSMVVTASTSQIDSIHAIGEKNS
jgi:hypothetical protein